MTIGISTKGNQIKGTMVSNLLLTRRFKGTTPISFALYWGMVMPSIPGLACLLSQN